MPCEEASKAQARAPAPAAVASHACRRSLDAVVSRVARRSAPNAKPSVPARAHGTPAALSACANKCTTVVLPLVPVTAAHHIAPLGSPAS